MRAFPPVWMKPLGTDTRSVFFLSNLPRSWLQNAATDSEPQSAAAKPSTIVPADEKEREILPGRMDPRVVRAWLAHWRTAKKRQGQYNTSKALPRVVTVLL